MLHINSKNTALTAIVAAVIFSSSISNAQTTTTTTTRTTHTAPAQPQANTPTTKQVEVVTEEHKEDIGSSAYTLGATIMTTVFPTATSEASSGRSKKAKVLINAKNDAALFIASKGQVRGVYLESAFNQLRKNIPTSQADDNQLAQAILSL